LAWELHLIVLKFSMWFLTDVDVGVLIHLGAISIVYKHSCFKNMNETLGIKSRTLDRDYN
jgi:hypothetical protein